MEQGLPPSIPPYVDYVLCIPGNPSSGEWTSRIVAIVSQMIREGKTFALAWAYCAYIDSVRNKCLQSMSSVKDDSRVDQQLFGGNLNYGHLVWIDSDNHIEYSMIKRLVAHDKDICAGWYKFVPPRNEDIDDHNLTCCGDFHSEYDGMITPMSAQDVLSYNDIFPVDYTGFGLVVIKNGVFEKLKYPWFHREVCYFTDAAGVLNATLPGEDIQFCKEIKKLGFQVFVDPDVRIPHEKKLMI